jgi:hypothetical protein
MPRKVIEIEFCRTLIRNMGLVIYQEFLDTHTCLRRIGGGTPRVTPVLATVRRSNVACSFCAPWFPKGAFRQRCT